MSLHGQRDFTFHSNVQRTQIASRPAAVAIRLLNQSTRSLTAGRSAGLFGQ